MTKSSEEAFNNAADRASYEQSRAPEADRADLEAKLSRVAEEGRQALLAQEQAARETLQDDINARMRELMMPPPPSLEMSGKPPRMPMREDEARQLAERDVHVRNEAALASIRVRTETKAQEHKEDFRIAHSSTDERESVIEKYRAQRKADRTDEVLRRSGPAHERDPQDRER